MKNEFLIKKLESKGLVPAGKRTLSSLGSFVAGLHEKATGIRSQCSHLIRGREARRGNRTAFL